jgi:hypothetical protein
MFTYNKKKRVRKKMLHKELNSLRKKIDRQKGLVQKPIKIFILKTPKRFQPSC